jgi:GDP-4-dehydro-6-deoxy-D-mannose reductase
MSKTVWITGASGFVGWQLAKYIRSSWPDFDVVALDINLPAGQSTELSFIQLDVSDPNAISDLFSKRPPTVVFHTVGLLPPAKPEEIWRLNTGITQRFATTLAKLALHPIRFIATGSAAEYGETDGNSLITEDFMGIPFSDYGESKLAGTNLLLALHAMSALDVIIVRPFNFAGPGLSSNLVLGKICEQIKSGNKTVRVGPLKPVRDFLDVRDGVAAYALLAEKGVPGQIYNLCSGVGHSIQEALDIALSLAPGGIEVEHKTGIPLGVAHAVGSREKLSAATGWSPKRSLRTSIKDMLR